VDVSSPPLELSIVLHRPSGKDSVARCHEKRVLAEARDIRDRLFRIERRIETSFSDSPSDDVTASAKNRLTLRPSLADLEDLPKEKPRYFRTPPLTVEELVDKLFEVVQRLAWRCCLIEISGEDVLHRGSEQVLLFSEVPIDRLFVRPCERRDAVHAPTAESVTRELAYRRRKKIRTCSLRVPLTRHFRIRHCPSVIGCIRGNNHVVAIVARGVGGGPPLESTTERAESRVRRGNVDPVQLEVLKNAFEGIADAMAITVLRTSRSLIVRLGYDFSTGLVAPNGELIAQGVCLPIHLGGMPVALDHCLRRYRDDLSPGDVLATNDPYEGGSHLPDIFLFKPIFAGNQLMAFACAMTHHTDMVGRVPGSNAIDSTEIFKEGLRSPPLKLYEKGIPNDTLHRILEKAVRVPDKVLGDLRGQVAALAFGEREFLHLVDRYGTSEILQFQEDLLNYSEHLTRRALASLVDGEWTFTDYIDDDGFLPGPFPIVATVRKRGDSIDIDFTGSAPQCKGAIQPVYQTTAAMVYAVLKCVLGASGHDIPNTGGYFRPVKVTAPLGTIVNPLPPAPVAARGLGAFRISHALFGAFAQMLPDIVPACPGTNDFLIMFAGYHKDVLPWKAWVLVDALVDVAQGASPDHDGADAQSGPIANTTNTPAELIELETPVRVERFEIASDREGAGRFRGGAGMIREYRVLQDDTIVQVRSDRAKHPPYGLHGGLPSAPSVVEVKRGGRWKRMPSKFVTTLDQGDHVRIEWPGGGGWGDPLLREPEAVLKDFVAGKVGRDRAREAYGVIVSDKDHEVDWSATEATRRSRSYRGG
jgi:N-methylhydantoinase B